MQLLVEEEAWKGTGVLTWPLAGTVALHEIEQAAVTEMCRLAAHTLVPSTTWGVGSWSPAEV